MIYHPIVWLKRLRHRRGYGIHSPWTYHFVTQVIYNDGEYYDYPALQHQFHLQRGRRKIARLLFRLADWFQPDEMRIPTSLPKAEQAYLLAGCKHAQQTVSHSEQEISFLKDNKHLATISLSTQTKNSRPPSPTERKGLVLDLYDLTLTIYNAPTQPLTHIINF